MKSWILIITAFLGGVAMANPGVEFEGSLSNGGFAFTGEVRLTVSAYAEPADEDPLWTEVFPQVSVQDGVFMIRLFRSDAVDLTELANDTLHIGIAVDDNPEMRPRRRLPFAARSLLAHTAIDAIGDINPSSVSVNGQVIINNEGVFLRTS